MTLKNYSEILQHISELSGHDYESKINTALNEKVKIMPVMHAVASSAFQVIRELQRDPPQAIFIEGPPEFTDYIRLLDGCYLPVSFLAAPRRNVEGAEDRTTITLPMLLASAETQAILFGRQNNIPVYFVDVSLEDRACRIKARKQKLKEEMERKQAAGQLEPKPAGPLFSREDDDILRLHATMHAILRDPPSNMSSDFGRELRLASHTTSHSEYCDYYLDREVRHLDFESWRRVMLLEGVIASFPLDALNLKLRENVSDESKEFHEEVRHRDQVMWSNIKQHLKENDYEPSKTVFICGAAHAVTFVPEFGTEDLETFEIDRSIFLEPEDYDFNELYHIGVLPNSDRSVDNQFNHVPGFTRRITDRFRHTCEEKEVKFFLPQELPGDSSAARELPVLAHISERDNVTNWAQSVTVLGRAKGLLTSTADAISIAESTDLLASLRNRSIPSISDFVDGALMTLAKEPDQIQRVLEVCYEIFGVSETGQIPNSALPALLQDFFRRLEHIPGLLDAKNGTKTLNYELSHTFDLRDTQHPQYEQYKKDSILLWRMLHLIKDMPFAKNRFPILPVLGNLTLMDEPGQEDWRLLLTTTNIRNLISVSLIAPTVEDALELNFLDDYRKKPAFSEALGIYIRAKTLQIGTTTLDDMQNQLLDFAREVSLKDSYLSLTFINMLILYFDKHMSGTPLWFRDVISVAFQKICLEISQGFIGKEEPLNLSQGLSFLDNMASQLLRWGIDATTQIVVTLTSIQNIPMAAALRTLYLVAQKKWFCITDAEFEQNLKIAFAQENNLDVCLGLMLSLFFYAKLAPRVGQLLHHNLSTLSDKAVFEWLIQLVQVLSECPPHLVATLLKSQQLATTAVPTGSSSVSIEDFDAFLAALSGGLDLPEITLEVEP